LQNLMLTVETMGIKKERAGQNLEPARQAHDAMPSWVAGLMLTACLRDWELWCVWHTRTVCPVRHASAW
jgi:hypothetical protein